LLEESLLQFLCVQTVTDKIYLSIRAKMIGGGRPLLRDNVANTDPPFAQRRFSIYCRS